MSRAAAGKGRERAKRTVVADGSTQRHVLRLLCRGPQTVTELAAQSRLTGNAIRAQLRKLHRKGLVRAAGVRPGTRRPHVEYEITPNGRETFPTAYEPLLKALVDVMVERLSPRQTLSLLRDSGTRLLSRFVRGTGHSPRSRAINVLRDFGAAGAAVELIEGPGAVVIRSCSCPLASLTAAHPEICRLSAELLGAAIGTEVREVCERGDFPRCAFEMPHALRGGRK